MTDETYIYYDVVMHNPFFGLNLKEYRAPRLLKQRYTCTPGTVPVLYKSQKFRVRVWGSYRTYRRSGYGWVRKCYRTHGSSGYCGTGVQNSQVSGRYKNAVPIPRVFVSWVYRAYRSSGYMYECRTKLTEFPGTAMNVRQNLQKLFVG